MAAYRVNFMLPKINRLKKTKDIERIFKQGRGAREGSLFLKSAENDLRVARFAFIISKGVAPKAVVRNKIKRMLRAAVRRRMPRIKAGLDMVVVVQKSAGNKKFQEIEKDLEQLFKKANLITL